MAKDRKPAEIERDRRNISRLYLQGKIQAEIAVELKLSQSTISRELKLLQGEWKQERVYDINEAKARELAKLDNLELEYWEAWKRSQKNSITNIDSTGPLGRTKTMKDENQFGDSRFLDGVMDCIKQRCAILGVEAPKKISSDPQANINIDWDELSPDQILRIRNGEDIASIKSEIDEQHNKSAKK